MRTWTKAGTTQMENGRSSRTHRADMVGWFNLRESKKSFKN